MARITAAFGTSHSVMLTSQLDDWQHGFKQADPKNPYYFNRQGEHLTYDQVLERAPAGSADMVTPERMAERYYAAHKAMDTLRDRLKAALIDVLIVIGDDQDEVFTHTIMPAFGIYYADTILNAKRMVKDEDPWFVKARAQRQEPDGDVHYPVDSALATYLIRALSDACFDIAALGGLAEGTCEGHAFSFPHRLYMQGLDLPVVPVFLNTFEPPNQPTPKRCVQLGRALREAILAYPGDLRVGIMASGGLSHFLVEEDLDQAIIAALKAKDIDFLAGLKPEELKAGSSEIRNWIVAAAAVTDLSVDWVEYVPGYRTEALTGTGLCFATWS